MLKTIKIPLIATFIVAFMFILQGLQIINLAKKELEKDNLFDLIAKSNEVKSNISSINFSSNLIYKYAILDKNLNIVFSNLTILPPNFDFNELNFKQNLFYKDFFFYDDELYFLIISKEINYKRIVLLALFMLAITIMASTLVMYFVYVSITKPHLEQKKMMNTFFNDAMHELKTPLGVASINLEILETKNKQTHRIKAALKQMKITYEDVEFFIKNDRIKFPKKVLNFSNFLENRIRFSSTIAHSKKIQIVSEISPNLKVFLSEIEATRLIDNNLSNAIKYSNESSKINVYLKSDDSFAIFIIEDFGCGIKDVDTIWQRYTRQNQSQGGFGLGLNIVMKICNKNDILYDVKSIPKKGSIFTYKIPLYEEKLLDNI
ncbi:HAMP domain-containing sensor histidine kinase [Campylobacter ureolyticus]|uniref:sensor histidine kinase n=1 Tax=Campylobacter ureolyticus TaxID=827 RepID=UPI0022B2BAED|nr:HAMP domain-containing sensor histidine kinase [Campylobacter ureolyticus]MCZ6186706.1 HAMP domain-containing sensor histidine kinase [Campylobacter ureolyticus]